MPDLREQLNRLANAALAEALGERAGAEFDAGVIPAARPEFGDYQANGVMAIAKRLGEAPRALATRACANVRAQAGSASPAKPLIDQARVAGQVVATMAPKSAKPLIDQAEVAGPGFINLRLADAALRDAGNAILDDPATALAPAEQPLTIVIDYSSPNLAKEMHVGHLRGTIIGDCLARVFERLGHQVIRQNHVGDWGTQFGMLLAYLEEQGAAAATDSAAPTAQPGELADLEAFYQRAKSRFDADPAFAERARQAVVALQAGDPAHRQAWERFIAESLSHCERLYERLGITLGRADLKPESAYNEQLPGIVAELESQGLVTVSDGARCVFLDEFTGKDGGHLPIIIQKSDGGYLYATTDLAALRHRSRDLGADRSLYVVDARQSLHFQQVFALGRRAGFATPATSLEHIAYGTMMGRDGKPFQTRTGGVVKLADLLAEAVSRARALVAEKNPDLGEEERDAVAEAVGIGAVKYADLAKNRGSDYAFDWNLMLSFEGNTAPYLLYAYARIQSVLRKHSGTVETCRLQEPSQTEERDLLLRNLQLAETVNQVARDCFPNTLCQYLHDLAGRFMRFYEACPILTATAEVRDTRLALARLTAISLREGLGLLGIEAIDRM